MYGKVIKHGCISAVFAGTLARLRGRALSSLYGHGIIRDTCMTIWQGYMIGPYGISIWHGYVVGLYGRVIADMSYIKHRWSHKQLQGAKIRKNCCLRQRGIGTRWNYDPDRGS